MTVWMRWLRLPFTTKGLAPALVAAAAVPAFLLAAADLWESAAGDELTRRVVAVEDTTDLGIEVSSDAFFLPEPLREADAALTAAFSSIDALDPVSRTMATPLGWGLVGEDFEPTPVQVRLFSGPGAVESLDLISGSREGGGVYVSDWLAGRIGVGVGDRLTYSSTLEPEVPGAEAAPAGGPTADFEIAGIYATLWDEEGSPPPDRWADTKPAGIVPRFNRPFNLPSFALLVLDDARLSNSGVSGSVIWHAPLAERPEAQSDLIDLAGEYAALERSLTVDPDVARRLDALSPTTTAPRVETAVPLALREVVTLASRLNQPLGSVKTAGLGIGLAVVLASGVLAVERRRTEFRLLAGEGDRWDRFAARAAAQMLVPTILGVTAGIVVARVVAGLAFTRIEGIGVVQPLPIVVVSGFGLLGAALTTGLMGQATLGSARIGERRPVWPIALGLVAAAAFLWAQVGRTRVRGPAPVDISVAALPVVVLLAAVGVVIVGLEAVARRTRTRRRSFAPVTLLAWRRVTAGSLGSRLIVGAVGVGLGLVVFSSILVATLNRSISVKSAVAAGGETSIELTTHPSPQLSLPERTTVISQQVTRTTPGDANVTILAIETDTFAEAVSWPDGLGGSAEELIAFLESDIGFNLPVVGISGQQTPLIGGFGTFQSSPYQLVARFPSLPMASSETPTLMVSAARLDQFELDRLVPGLGLSPDDPQVDDVFVSPVERFRPFLVSQAPPSALAAFIDSSGLVPREVVTRDSIEGAIDTIGARFAFDYLQLLGYVAAVTAATGLVLYLAARRQRRALANVMTRRMGLRPRTAALITTLEVGVLATVAAITGAALAPQVSQHLIPRFDPAPDLPPTLGVVVPATAVISLVAGVVAVAAIVWVSEWRTNRRSAGGVLRELN